MTGGAKEISREEMRAFKKVWAEFANSKTGYLERNKFVPFFGRLSGIFEVKIYPTEYSIPKIMARSAGDTSEASFCSERHPRGLDLFAMEANVSSVDRLAIKRRKNVYNRLYHEARISYEPGKGISFTNMLLLLAHHKLIMDNEALVLQDLVVRTETNKLVTDLVDFDKVQSLLLMISQRRRYLAMREQARVQRLMQEGVPDIVVSGGEPMTPPSSTRDITSPLTGYMGPDTPRARNSILSPEISFGSDTPSRTGLQRSKRVSDGSMLTALDMGTRISFDGSISRESRVSEDGDVLPSLENSIWGEMLLQAAEEDL